MTTQYAVLQSGYITLGSPMIVVPESISPDKINVSLKLGKTVDNYHSPFQYHKGIEELYSAFNNNDRLLNDFDFREKIILCLIDAVSNRSFYAWCDLQKKSDHYEAKHAAFIKDTLNFICNGQRAVSIENWLSIIEAAERKVYPGKIDDPLENFPKDLDMTKVIVAWTAKQHGFKDMLYFTKIVFGKTFNRRV